MISKDTSVGAGVQQARIDEIRSILRAAQEKKEDDDDLETLRVMRERQLATLAALRKMK